MILFFREYEKFVMEHPSKDCCRKPVEDLPKMSWEPLHLLSRRLYTHITPEHITMHCCDVTISKPEWRSWVERAIFVTETLKHENLLLYTFLKGQDGALTTAVPLVGSLSLLQAIWPDTYEVAVNFPDGIVAQICKQVS